MRMMKGPTIEEVRALREETGEGMMACKKILEQRYAEREKQEMSIKLWSCDIDNDLRQILEYLIRKS